MSAIFSLCFFLNLRSNGIGFFFCFILCKMKSEVPNRVSSYRVMCCAQQHQAEYFLIILKVGDSFS